MNKIGELPLPHMISHAFGMSAMDRHSLIVSVSLRCMQLYSCLWKCFFFPCFFDRGERET